MTLTEVNEIIKGCNNIRDMLNRFSDFGWEHWVTYTDWEEICYEIFNESCVKILIRFNHYTNVVTISLADEDDEIVLHGSYTNLGIQNL